VIIWPRALKVINELSEVKGFSTVELISLPLRIRVTVSYIDGTWTVHDVNQDGGISEVFSS
jgi:hypothetical protein